MVMLPLDLYQGIESAWCPGCGNFGLLKAFKQALAELEITPEEIAIVSGIGQSGKFPHYLKCNMINGIHGRTLPVATGIRLANHGLKVVAVAGDGDCYGEGGNHLLAALRKNPDLTLVVHNNQVYALTKGQASPTTDQGYKTLLQPHGVPYPPLHALAIAVAQECSWVARGFAGRGQHLTGLYKQAMKAWHPEEKEAVRFLKIVTDPKRAPVLVHCQHGADRTGTMVAVYRIAVQGWSKDEAIREMTQGGFGFHPTWSNLPKWIENLDIDRLKRQAGIKSPTE
jgi:hypothetical protein